MKASFRALWRALQELSGEAALRRALAGCPEARSTPAGRKEAARRLKEELTRRFESRGPTRCC